MRARLFPIFAIFTVLLVANGCSLFSLAFDLAAKALPYLIFLASTEDGPRDPAAPVPEADEGEVRLALERARRCSSDLASSDPGSSELPSGWSVLSRRLEQAGDSPVIVYAFAVDGRDPDDRHMSRYQALAARHGQLEVVAIDASSLLDGVDAEARRSELADAGLVLYGDGPLAAAIVPHLAECRRQGGDAAPSE